jgi:hypothetical protein
MQNGVVLYDGPSQIDGTPIVAIATGLDGSSNNRKTGRIVQTWILAKYIAPCRATKEGSDYAVCGNCKHRRCNLNSCYVLIHQAPQIVWRNYQRGIYEVVADFSIFKNKIIRIGSYGDPAAAPIKVWKDLLKHCKNWTGYTHGWETKPSLKPYVMASCDTMEEYKLAKKKGWNTFRVRMPDGELFEGEKLCRNEKTGVQCLTCGLCNGTLKGEKHVVVTVHGIKGWNLKRFVEKDGEIA